MKKTLKSMIFSAAFAFFSIPAAFSNPRGAQELVEPGHWIYDSLTAISLDAGILNFSGTAPVTIKEIELYLKEVDYESLSEVGKSEYDRIQKYFGDETLNVIDSDILTVGFEPTFNLSGFYKTEDDVDWVYDRYERKPLIDAPVSIAAGDFVTMKMDVFLGQNKGAMSHNDNYTNLILSPDDIDNAFPDSGYFSIGRMFTEKTGFNFQLGKGTRSVGRTLTGSVIWSEYLTGVSYGQIELFSPNFKYTGGISQFNVDKYMYHHQLDARFFNKIQITFLEGLLVNAPMELRFMNPWMIFHGFSAWRDYEPEESDPESHTCDYFAIVAQVTPFKYTRFYGTFAMTQYQTSYERTNWPDTPTPNGLGAQLGTELYIPYGQGRFHFGLEGYWADPYLYIKESPNWSLSRTYSENMGDKAIFYEWIGSPFGPDTISGELKAGYEVPAKWSVDFVYLFMARGENSGTNVFDRLHAATGWGGQKTAFDATEETSADTKAWAYPDKGQSDWEEKRDSTSPSGTPEYVNRISLRGTWNANSWLKFTVQPSYVFIFNYDNTAGEKRNGAEFALAMEFKLLDFLKK